MTVVSDCVVIDGLQPNGAYFGHVTRSQRGTHRETQYFPPSLTLRVSKVSAIGLQPPFSTGCLAVHADSGLGDVP